MDAKHTPGPWKAVRASHGVVDVFDNNDHDIVTLFGCNRGANARLIAAAPELLEALREITKSETITDRDLFHRACMAIAKATGEKA